jgi:hypothetical protein
MTGHELQKTREPFEDELWRLEIIEGRRAQADGFTWAVPGLAFAGQAFLLSVVLQRDITSLARLVAACAGVVAAVAAAHLYAKQVYLFNLYEAFIENRRQCLGLPGTQLDELKAVGFPPNTTFKKRRWDDTRSWRYQLIVRHSSAAVWSAALLSFVVLDAALFIYSLVLVIRDALKSMGVHPLRSVDLTPGDLVIAVVGGLVATGIWVGIEFVRRRRRQKRELDWVNGDYQVRRKSNGQLEPEKLSISVNKNVLTVQSEGDAPYRGDIAMDERFLRSGVGTYRQTKNGDKLFGYWAVQVAKDENAIFVHTTYASPDEKETLSGFIWERIA